MKADEDKGETLLPVQTLNFKNQEDNTVLINGLNFK